MFNSKYNVIAIGSATRDVFLKLENTELRDHNDSATGVEQCFPLGTKLEVKEITMTTGGGGTNAAVTFGRQGLKTSCIGVIGQDSAGREIIAELEKEGVTPMFQIHDDDSTAYSTILRHPDAERTILSYKGEGQHFDVKRIDFNKLKSNWLYLDSLGGHYDLLEALMAHAVKNKIRVACNPGGKEIDHGLEKLTPFLKNIDIFAVNKEEGAQLAGTKAEDIDQTIKRLAEICKGIIIITDGHHGVRVFQNNVMFSAGVPDSPIVERTGAGDAFNSGFVCEFIRSRDIKKAIQFATANSSSVVTKIGSKAGILKKGDWGPWPLVEVEERR